MNKRPRRTHSPAFKAKVALDAIGGEKTLVELAKQHDVHANPIIDWKNHLLTGAVDLFGGEHHDPVIDVKPLHAKIGQHALEIDFLAGAPNKAGAEAFIEFLLSPAGQEYFAAKTKEFPLVPGTAAAAEVPPLGELSPPQIDLSQLSSLEQTQQLLSEVGLLTR